jgi:hypothetical protein
MSWSTCSSAVARLRLVAFTRPVPVGGGSITHSAMSCPTPYASPREHAGTTASDSPHTLAGSRTSTSYTAGRDCNPCAGDPQDISVRPGVGTAWSAVICHRIPHSTAPCGCQGVMGPRCRGRTHRKRSVRSMACEAEVRGGQGVSTCSPGRQGTDLGGPQPVQGVFIMR